MKKNARVYTVSKVKDGKSFTNIVVCVELENEKGVFEFQASPKFLNRKGYSKLSINLPTSK